MRLTRLAIPVLLLAALSACAANAGAEASVSTARSGQAADAVLLNRAEGLRLMDSGYPQLLRDARVTGDVLVEVTLGADGTVASTRVVQSTQDQFSAAAASVARRLRFGVSGAAGTTVPVRFLFRLDGSADVSVQR